MNLPPADNLSAQTLLEPDALSAWLHLANLQLSPRMAVALLRYFYYDPQALLSATDTELDDVLGTHPRSLVRLRDPELLASPRQIAWMQKHQVQIVWLDHPDYPR